MVLGRVRELEPGPGVLGWLQQGPSLPVSVSDRETATSSRFWDEAWVYSIFLAYFPWLLAVRALVLWARKPRNQGPEK